MFAAVGMIDVLIPLLCGVYLLLIPVRRKKLDEPEEEVTARRQKLRMCGGAAILIALGYYLLKQASQP